MHVHRQEARETETFTQTDTDRQPFRNPELELGGQFVRSL